MKQKRRTADSRGDLNSSWALGTVLRAETSEVDAPASRLLFGLLLAFHEGFSSSSSHYMQASPARDRAVLRALGSIYRAAVPKRRCSRGLRHVETHLELLQRTSLFDTTLDSPKSTGQRLQEFKRPFSQTIWSVQPGLKAVESLWRPRESLQ